MPNTRVVARAGSRSLRSSGRNQFLLLILILLGYLVLILLVALSRIVVIKLIRILIQ